MKRAVVVGAGFGGIAAALRLRARGYDVTIIDRCKRLGGRAQVFERDGFIYDAGPTVITAPFLLEELFELFNKQLSDYIDIMPVEPWYRFYYPDGETFDYGGDLEDTLKEINRIAPEDSNNYQRLLNQSQAIFDIGFSKLAHRPFHSFATMIRQIPQLIKLRSYKSVHALVSQYLTSDRLRQAFSIQPLLVGGNPFDTTSIYNLIHFLERKWGIHYARGGMGAVINGLETLLREEGVDIQLQTTVNAFNVESNRIKSLVLGNGERVEADLVVSNMDPTYLYGKLIPKQDQPVLTRLKTRRAKLSMGLYVLYFGTNKTYPDVAHHTIWLGKRYKALLNDIFNNKILADDFSLYLHRPTATDPQMAPPGNDCFYVLSPVPNLQGAVDWATTRDQYRDKILTALESTLLPGLKASLVHSFDMTPDEFQSDYLSTAGAGFSIAPRLTQSAWFRYHNKGECYDNLFLVGAGTHPGAGLPGVISSAKVVDEILSA